MTESVFGCNDWLSSYRAFPNMAQATRSVMVEFAYNKTMKWLKLKGEEHKAALVTISQAKRREIQRERKQKAAVITENKVQQRSKALELARTKHIKHQQKVKHLTIYDLITTVPSQSS